jgi:glycerol-3-phosphate acyltransferase PlsY
MALSDLLSTLGFALFGYLSGSLAFSVWVTRWIKGVDVRQTGSRHATATNAIRQAGWTAGGLVILLDIAKGFVPTYLAVRYGASPGRHRWRRSWL